MSFSKTIWKVANCLLVDFFFLVGKSSIVRRFTITNKKATSGNKKESEGRQESLYFIGHSTRLFPKGDGPNGYNLTGLAAWCDWVILSDSKAPYFSLENKSGSNTPRTIFVSMRHDRALEYFVRVILPKIKNKFILFTGSEDRTFPMQTDVRFAKPTKRNLSLASKILNSGLLRHWYCENLDYQFSERVSPLPLGFVTHKKPPHELLKKTVVVGDGALKALIAHRVREGPQWHSRKLVMHKCRQMFPDTSTMVEREIPYVEYQRLLGSHAFTVCVEGGGLDPAPKAFDAIYNGSIPIIRRSPTADSYNRLPVIFIDNWDQLDLTCENLIRWREEIQEKFFGIDVCERLSLNYWWKLCERGGVVA